MTDEQGDRIIALLDTISGKLSDVLIRQDSLEELLEPWQQACDRIETNTDRCESQLDSINTDINLLTRVARYRRGVGRK